VEDDAMREDEVAAFGVGERGRPWSESDGGRPDGEADCEETVRRLYFFLDGALTEERRIAIRAHLDRCGDCFEALGFETELRRVVADRCKEHVPEPLKQRIAEAIRKEQDARGQRPTAGAEPL
jgi:mycothiol system anti-sigma-R factor